MDQETLDLLKKFKDGLDSTPESFAELEKRLNAYNKSLKAQQPILQQWGDFFKGRTKEHRQVMDEYDKAIEKTIKNTENLSQVEVDSRVRKLEGMKAEGLLTASKNRATMAAKAFGAGVAGVTNQVAMAALDFVQDLQSSKEGTEIIGAANMRAAKASGDLAKSVGNLAQAFGILLAILPVGKAMKFLGGAIALLGGVVEEAAPKMSELAEKGVATLNTEIEKTKKSFRDISSTGAYFSGGISEMRRMARSAGIEIGLMSEIVKGNGEALSRMGLGVNEGIKRFASINAAIRNGRLAEEFRRLGFDAKEYGQASIEAAGMLQTSGRLREMTEGQVAEYTMEYVKNLKVLQNITGQDARKKMEEARKQSMEADLYARAMQEGGLEAVTRLQNVLANTPEVIKTAMLQNISSGGRAVTDIASRVLMARNPEVQKLLDLGIKNIKDRNATTEQITASMQEQIKKTSGYALENSQSMGRIGEAGRLANNQLLQSAAGLQTGLIELGLQYEGINIKDQFAEVNKTVKGASDSLGTNIHKLDEKVLGLQSKLANDLTPLMNDYANLMHTSYDLAKQFNDVLMAATKGLVESGGGTKWQPKPGSGPNDLTGLPGDKRTNAQKAKDDADVKAKRKSYNALGFDQPNIDPYEAAARKGKAKGGISTGPLSGYQEVLHGTEAVIPLPDNRSIPVSLDSSSLTSSLERNNSLLNDIVRILKEGNNLSSHIARSVA